MNKETPASSRSGMTRRNLFRNVAAGAVALNASPLSALAESTPAEGLYRVRNGRIQQSAVHWCFSPMTPLELADHAADLGMASVEIVSPEFWPELKKRGLVCAMAFGHPWNKGFAQKSEHEECLAALRKIIDQTAAAGFKNVITFSGLRKGLTEEDATKNTVEGLKRIAGYAEEKNVTLCVEMLNSRVHAEMRGHPDYFCDHIDKTVDICKQAGSERVKVLFDIYHVQIMDGDIISHIRQHHHYIGHYHTAGVPGRNEIDDAQEINYPAIMRAIVATGYTGYVGQEFVPLGDKVAALSDAVRRCDV